MIESFKITTNHDKISIYAGMVTSAFAFAEFSTGVVWGRFSDRIGRKPVLLGGLAGTGLSMMIFGFAPNLFVALLGRALGGLLNGYPFLLPNLVCAVILACGVVIGILFLEETHVELKDRRDVGLEAGRWILSHFKRSPAYAQEFDKAADANMDESRSLLEDDLPPGYRTTDGSPRHPSSRAESPDSSFHKLERTSRPMGMQKAFTKQVVLNIVGYGILA
ncbi:MAG: hypothetical protein Q9187_002944 [Circinaria calcarea]